METMSSWRATYVPGRWLVLGGPTSLVVMQPAPAHMSGLVSDLWEDVLSAADVSDLAQRFTAFRLDLMPHFAAFFWDEDGMHSLVRGGLRAVDPDTGEVVAEGEGFRTWNEVGLQSLQRVRVDMDELGDEPLLALPLAVGVVLASSVTIDSTQTVPLVPPVTATGDVWAPSVAASASPEADAVPSAPAIAEAAPATAEEDSWGVRDAGPVTPVELLVDENGDGIPDAQQQGEPEGEQADALTIPLGGAVPEPWRPDPFSLEAEAGPHVSEEKTEAFPFEAPTSPFGQPQVGLPGPSFVGQPFPDQPFSGQPFTEQPFTEQPFTAPYGVAQPVYPPFVPGAPFPTGPRVSPVPPPAARRAASPDTGPVEPLVPGLSVTEGIGTDGIVLSPGVVQPRTGGGANDLVLAALCAYGHPNRPGSARCRVCGNSVDNAGARLVQRPVLAQLVTAQGARVDVKGTVLVGRAPQAKPGDDDAALLAVPSPNSDISRTHVMVTVHFWDVVATDLHSTNGTTLVRPGQAPVRMMPGAPVTVEPGTILDLGDGGLITVGLPG